MTTPCPRAAEVDAHFDAKAPSFGARALFAHLPSCTSCRARYERHLALESLDPEAPGAKERMRRGLAPPGRARRWYLPVGGAIALAACLMLVLGRPGTGDGFSPRGATSVPTDAPRVEIYKVTPGAPPERVDGAIARQDELAFAYANPSGKKRLLVTLGVPNDDFRGGVRDLDRD